MEFQVNLRSFPYLLLRSVCRIRGKAGVWKDSCLSHPLLFPVMLLLHSSPVASLTTLEGGRLPLRSFSVLGNTECRSFLDFEAHDTSTPTFVSDSCTFVRLSDTILVTPGIVRSEVGPSSVKEVSLIGLTVGPVVFSDFVLVPPSHKNVIVVGVVLGFVSPICVFREV